MIIDPLVWVAITQAALYEEVDLNLLAGVISVESNFDPLALGDRDANDVPQSFGLGQHNTGGFYGYLPAETLLNPFANARLTAKALNWCGRQFNTDEREAIACYNAGQRNVIEKGWNVARAYVLKVQGERDRIEAEGLGPQGDRLSRFAFRLLGPIMW